MQTSRRQRQSITARVRQSLRQSEVPAFRMVIPANISPPANTFLPDRIDR